MDIELQKIICDKNLAKFVDCDLGQIAGISNNIGDINIQPINGLRHPISKGTCGWYIWRGELSSDDDFFKPMHVSHIIQQVPEVMQYLGLAPGWRFMIDPSTSYTDVWYDKQLLNI